VARSGSDAFPRQGSLISAFKFWKHLTHRSAEEVVRSRYLDVGVVDVLLDMLGTREQADKAGHLLQQSPPA